MFTKNYFRYHKNKTQKVFIGDVPLGENFPIRLQSMTNTDTEDIETTVHQIIEIADAGADYVRLTVQTSRIAEKLSDIKNLLKAKNRNIPLIADIHFSPKAAETAAQIIEKVRINPGNYADLKQFKHIEYTDEEYAEEVEKIKVNFLPLLKICKENNTTIRIGTNHGSLSDRILSRYGDTPEGMVEATMEFLRICKTENFNNVVISMKASNPLVMIYANRLLVDKMQEENMHFPLHLGVTEAGNELEGRIKSAMGIGTLLVDGIGDTIRVSLTENPANEIPVAKIISEIFHPERFSTSDIKINPVVTNKNFYDYNRRKSSTILNIGGNNIPVVISTINKKNNQKDIIDSGYAYKDNKFTKTDLSADFLFFENTDEIINSDSVIIPEKNNQSYKVTDLKGIDNTNKNNINFLLIDASELQDNDFEKIKNLTKSILILDLSNCTSAVHSGRAFFMKLIELDIENPVIIRQKFNQIDKKAVLQASAETGALFIDGFGDGIMISGGKEDIQKANELSFGILQACRTRISKTEYISCPSCGRTLFDLEKTTAKIKEKTAHLKGIKIAIMGCIVNGLGEMADADYGYVGTGSGKVTLYKNKEVIKRNIPEKDAPDELLKLIEQYL